MALVLQARQCLIPRNSLMVRLPFLLCSQRRSDLQGGTHLGMPVQMIAAAVPTVASVPLPYLLPSQCVLRPSMLLVRLPGTSLQPFPLLSSPFSCTSWRFDFRAAAST